MRIGVKEIIHDFPKRLPYSHKGTYGKILNIAGSAYYAGAAILSSLSALKIGAGYVTLACPENIATAVISYTPDITIFPLKTNGISSTSENIYTLLKKAEDYDVISIGSGLSDNPETKKLILDFLSKNDKPTVIDADALNAIAASGFTELNKNTIITPHPREMSRLLNVETSEILSNREKYVLEAAKKFNCIAILKGKDTLVTDGEDIYTNKTGSSALAKAGTGDVLTGMISGLLAQSKNSLYSAAAGVYLHGLTADIAENLTTKYGLLASELIDCIPQSIMKIL